MQEVYCFILPFILKWLVAALIASVLVTLFSRLRRQGDRSYSTLYAQIRAQFDEWLQWQTLAAVLGGFLGLSQLENRTGIGYGEQNTRLNETMTKQIERNHERGHHEAADGIQEALNDINRNFRAGGIISRGFESGMRHHVSSNKRTHLILAHLIGRGRVSERVSKVTRYAAK